ncbi:unnamed protein product [Hermetia illucens]|uniref:X-box-binding protein 1 n=1 Tax=Hermetia illucens TaxID=343691 RepID=A0A7R8YYF9_HERIL|nr:unnamed protein product [Hermetia illucens]
MSAPILITVPKYVAISPSPMPRTLQPAVPPPGDVPSGDCPRAKKRRLDHLTWEEKIQRKKLKNRVAAQTSRDRKKARMEDMEHTIAMLTQQTEILQNKCDSLQAINESLLSKNEKLDHQVEKLQKEIEELRRQQASEPAIIPSAEGKISTGVNSVRPERQLSCSLADNSPLPSLQDLLEDFDASKLEELAESLLADITADMERGNPPCVPDDAKSPSRTERLPGSVVGSSAEHLEPSEDSSMYSIKPVEKPTKSAPQKLNSLSTVADPETLYGTYDEKTNSITIVMPDGDISVEEAVEVVCDTPDEEDVMMDSTSSSAVDAFDPIKEFLCPKEPVVEAKSPLSTHSISDCGYESIGSPQSDMGSLQLDDIWSSSFTELFPSLA